MDYRNFSKIWFRSERFVWQTPPGTPEAPKPPEAAPAAPAAAPSANPAEQARAAKQKAEKAAEKGADAAKRLEQASATPEVSGDKKSDTPHAAAEAATAAAALSAAEEAAEEGSGNEEGLIDKLIKLITQWIDKLMGKKDEKSAKKKETSLLGGAEKLVIAKKYDEAKKEEGIGIKTKEKDQIFPPRGGIIEDFTDDSMTVKTSDGFVITYKGIKPNPNLGKGSRVTAGGVAIGEAKGETVTIIAQNSAGAFVDPTPLVQKYLPPEPAAPPAATAATPAEAAPATAAATPAKPAAKKAAGKPVEKKEAASASSLKLSEYDANKCNISIEAPASTPIKFYGNASVEAVDKQKGTLTLIVPGGYTVKLYDINSSLNVRQQIKPNTDIGVPFDDKKPIIAVCTREQKKLDATGKPLINKPLLAGMRELPSENLVYEETYVDPTAFFKAPEKKKEEPTKS